MAWVAWWGKMLVFVAGIAVVIDLVEPATLRRIGVTVGRRAVAAIRRRRRRLETSRLAGLRHDVPETFVHLKFYGNDEDGTMYWSLAGAPPARSPVPWVDTASFTAFWHTVMAEIRQRYDVWDTEWTEKLEGSLSYARQRVDELLWETVPPGLRRPLDRAATTQNRTSLLLVATMLGGLLLPIVGLVTMRAGGTATDRLGALLVGTGVVLVAVSILAVAVDEATGLTRTYGLFVASGWRAVAGLVLRAANTLNRTRPLHPFRWLAFGLFLVGSVLELVSSFPPVAPR